MCEEIFFIAGSGWRHRGRTDRRSSAVTQRVEEILYIIREAALISSTSTEPGGRTSCYFEFSSLQSRVISVWGWLNLGMFGYRSPIGVDLHRQRIQESFYIDRRRKGGSEHPQRTSRRRSAPAESRGRIKFSTRRIQESFYIDRRRKGGSEQQHRRIQEKICIGRESWQHHPVDQKGSRGGSSSLRDRGDLLHHQRSGAEIL